MDKENKISDDSYSNIFKLKLKLMGGYPGKINSGVWTHSSPPFKSFYEFRDSLKEKLIDLISKNGFVELSYDAGSLFFDFVHEYFCNVDLLVRNGCYDKEQCQFFAVFPVKQILDELGISKFKNGENEHHIIFNKLFSKNKDSMLSKIFEENDGYLFTFGQNYMGNNGTNRLHINIVNMKLYTFDWSEDHIILIDKSTNEKVFKFLDDKNINRFRRFCLVKNTKFYEELDDVTKLKLEVIYGGVKKDER